MPSIASELSGLIEQQLLRLHVAFIAVLLDEPKTDGTLTTVCVRAVSPAKTKGRPPSPYPILPDVPVVKNALYYTDENGERKRLKKSDLVLCLCCDRDISEAIHGRQTLPTKGVHHQMGDAVVVGVI